jgi:hypothetical protein
MKSNPVGTDVVKEMKDALTHRWHYLLPEVFSCFPNIPPTLSG